MTKTSKGIDRRAFFRSTALASGGMIIGFNFFTACEPAAKPPVDLSKLNYNDFNGFINIADNGAVTLYAPNPEIGQGVKTSMPMIIAEELDVEWSNVHVVQGGLDKDIFERQVAGGSQSIRHGWEPLRQTGATARQMLINAAAARWGVEASTCTTDKGRVINAKGESFGYGELVNEAAVLKVPKDVTLKDIKDYSIIGQEVKNVDGQKIVTGQPLFGMDYRREGMVYACVARPPAFGQKLKEFDDSKTKSMSGVIEVVQFGDKVAVLAETTWQAMKAKDALVLTWEAATPLESTEDHDKLLNGLLDGKAEKTLREDGNVERAFKEADQVLERQYDSPFLPHNCMEPMNFFAHVTPEKIDLVGPIQTPAWTADRVAKLLDRDVSEISLDMTRMGGGFGRRLYGDFTLEAADISNRTGKPVMVVFSRDDDMNDGIYRMAIKYRIKAAVKDGKVTAYHLKEAAVNDGMYDLVPNFFPAGAISNYKVDSSTYKSNITTGAWRAPYTNFLSFAEQSFFDELAEMMEVDRIKLRLDLLQNVKGTTDEKIQYSAERMETVIKKAVEVSNWGKSPEGVYQGFSAYYCHNTHVAEVADVVMEDNKPVVKKVYCVLDCGVVVNPLGARNQVEGGVIDGIGHAMYGNFTFKDGQPQSTNFDTYRLIRMMETPQVETHFIENDHAPTGLGEPALPPAGAALANAIKAATGVRLYNQPFVANEKLLG